MGGWRRRRPRRSAGRGRHDVVGPASNGRVRFRQTCPVIAARGGHFVRRVGRSRCWPPPQIPPRSRLRGRLMPEPIGTSTTVLSHRRLLLRPNCVWTVPPLRARSVDVRSAAIRPTPIANCRHPGGPVGLEPTANRHDLSTWLQSRGGVFFFYSPRKGSKDRWRKSERRRTKDVSIRPVGSEEQFG